MKFLNRSFFLFIVAIAFSMVSFSCESDSKSLSLDPKTLDFKEVNRGDSEILDLIIKNKYGKDVTINSTSIDGSLDFTFSTTLPADYLLANKTEVTISISFAPSIDGDIEATLNINHDASDKPVEVALKGVGVPVPRISLAETTYDFGQVLISGSGKTHTFDIENIGTADLEISSLGFVGPNAGSYSITSGGNVPVIVAAGLKHTVEVKFYSPNVGTETATLEIGHDAVNETSPSTISLSADAIDRKGEISLNVANPWAYGSAPVGWVVVKPFEIENVGVDVLNIASLTLQTGSEYAVKEVLDNNGSPITTPFDLQIGEKASVMVEFTAPSATNFADKLDIVHDGTNVPTPLTLDIEGSGKTPTSKNFSYTGSVQNWTVPAGVYLIQVTANGGGGGGQNGGKGGKMVGFINVNPGDTLKVIVGGKGNERTYSRSGYGGAGYSGILDSGDNHVISAGGGGGCGNYGTYPAGGDGGGGNGATGGCSSAGGAGGTNGPSPSGGTGGVGYSTGGVGTSTGGGKGGDGGSNRAGGGGGGGWGTAGGAGGKQYSASGYGGAGGFGGGGGGAGGGWGSYSSRYNAGGGGGGGYAGGGGGSVAATCNTYGGGGGGGGSNYLDTTKGTIITDTKGGGAALKTDGSLTIEY